jgi:hypothetical protein
VAPIAVPFQVPVETVPRFDVVALRVVNVPAAAVVAPTVVPLMVPPVIATLFAACVDIVPRPDTCVLVMAIVVLPAAVSWPCALTVNVATEDADPYELAVTDVFVMLN